MFNTWFYLVSCVNTVFCVLVSVSFFVLVVLEMPKDYEYLPNPLLREDDTVSKSVQTYFVFEKHLSMSAKKVFCHVRRSVILIY
jgi:hypothetical protein